MTNEIFLQAKKIKDELYEIEKTDNLLKKVYSDNKSNKLDKEELETFFNKVSTILESFKYHKIDEFKEL